MKRKNINHILFLLVSLMSFNSFAGVYKAGIVFQNGLRQNLQLVSYRGDSGFINFIEHDLKKKLTNNNQLPKLSSIRTGAVEDVWQGEMEFSSLDKKVIVKVYYNGQYAPEHGRGLSCKAIIGARCTASGGWSQQQQIIQFY